MCGSLRRTNNRVNLVSLISERGFLSAVVFLLPLFFSFQAIAQSGLEGQIIETVDSLVRIINLVIVGFIAWSGFLIAKGEGVGPSRLIYGIVGLVVVNAAQLIINYFS